MDFNKSIYDGKLISELGVKRYLKAVQSVSTSNINFFLRGSEADKAWKECNFGCHGPTYRTAKRQSTYSEMLKPIHTFSPFAAGAVDSLRAKTVGQIESVARGVRRTADGLGLNGDDNFAHVGDENWAAYDFCKNTIEKVFTFEIDTPDNPIAQSVLAIVCEYTTVLPEWVVEEVYNDGALVLPEKIDSIWLAKLTSLGLMEGISNADLKIAATALNSNFAKKQAGSLLGKKLAVSLSCAIAAAVTKQILKRGGYTRILRSQLVNIRKNAQKMNGGLGGALFTQLKAQGFLDKAGQSNRRLQQGNPRIWRFLRYNLQGANMIYFLLEEMVEEYIDRLTLLEKNPIDFMKVMAILIKDKQTSKIFFP